MSELYVMGTMLAMSAGQANPVEQVRTLQFESDRMPISQDVNVMNVFLTIDDTEFYETWNLKAGTGGRKGKAGTDIRGFTFTRQSEGSVILSFEDGASETLFRPLKQPTGMYSYSPVWFLHDDYSQCFNRVLNTTDNLVSFVVSNTLQCTHTITDPQINHGNETCIQDGVSQWRTFVYKFNSDGSVTYILNSKSEDPAYPSAMAHPTDPSVLFHYIFPCNPAQALSGSWRDITGVTAANDAEKKQARLPLGEEDEPVFRASCTPAALIAPFISLFYTESTQSPMTLQFEGSKPGESFIFRGTAIEHATVNGDYWSTRFIFNFKNVNTLVLTRNMCKIGSRDCDSGFPPKPTNDKSGDEGDATVNAGPAQYIVTKTYQRCDADTMDQLIGTFLDELGNSRDFSSPTAGFQRKYTDDSDRAVTETVDMKTNSGTYVTEPPSEQGPIPFFFAFTTAPAVIWTTHTSLNSREAAEARASYRRYELVDTSKRYMSGSWLHTDLTACVDHRVLATTPYSTLFPELSYETFSGQMDSQPNCVLTPFKKASGGYADCVNIYGVHTKGIYHVSRTVGSDIVIMRLIPDEYQPDKAFSSDAIIKTWMPCTNNVINGPFFTMPFRQGLKYQTELALDHFEDTAGNVIEQLTTGITPIYSTPRTTDVYTPRSGVTPPSYVVKFSHPVEGFGTCKFYVEGYGNQAYISCPDQSWKAYAWYKVTASGYVLFRAKWPVDEGGLPSVAVGQSSATVTIILSRAYSSPAVLIRGPRTVAVRSATTGVDTVHKQRVAVNSLTEATVMGVQGRQTSVRFFDTGRVSVSIPDTPSAEAPVTGFYVIRPNGDMDIMFPDPTATPAPTVDSVDGPGVNKISLRFAEVRDSPVPHVGKWTNKITDTIKQCQTYTSVLRDNDNFVLRTNGQKLASGLTSYDIYAPYMPGTGARLYSTSNTDLTAAVVKYFTYRIDDGVMYVAMNKDDGYVYPSTPVNPVVTNGLQAFSSEVFYPCIQDLDVSMNVLLTQAQVDKLGLLDEIKFVEEDLCSYLSVDPRFVTAIHHQTVSKNQDVRFSFCNV